MAIVMGHIPYKRKLARSFTMTLTMTEITSWVWTRAVFTGIYLIQQYKKVIN